MIDCNVFNASWARTNGTSHWLVQQSMEHCRLCSPLEKYSPSPRCQRSRPWPFLYKRREHNEESYQSKNLIQKWWSTSSAQRSRTRKFEGKRASLSQTKDLPVECPQGHQPLPCPNPSFARISLLPFCLVVTSFRLGSPTTWNAQCIAKSNLWDTKHHTLTSPWSYDIHVWYNPDTWNVE